MNIYIKYLLIGISSLFLLNCDNYERKNECTLDGLSINGPVSSIEAISFTSVPLSEMYLDSYYLKGSLPISMGNYKMTFDNHGNITEFVSYGVDGEILEDTKSFVTKYNKDLIPIVFGSKEIEDVDDLEYIKDKKNNIHEIRYMNNNEPVWILKQKFNNDGEICKISKKYTKQNNSFHNLINFEDSTSFTYLDHDKHNNWTKAKITYYGVLKSHNFEYIIKRKINYYKEDENCWDFDKIPLYLSNVQKPQECTYSTKHTDLFDIEIPDFMKELSSKDSKYVSSHVKSTCAVGMDYLFMYSYEGKDSYASISASISNSGGLNYDDLSGTDLIYNSETDKIMQEAFEEQLSLNNIYILKWLPYKIVKLGGKKCMNQRYYRYGIGSPIPVYVDIYTISLNDDYCLSIAVSYQSKDYYRFHNVFEYCLNSIDLNL